MLMSAIAHPEAMNFLILLITAACLCFLVPASASTVSGVTILTDESGKCSVMISHSDNTVVAVNGNDSKLEVRGLTPTPDLVKHYIKLLGCIEAQFKDQNAINATNMSATS